MHSEKEDLLQEVEMNKRKVQEIMEKAKRLVEIKQQELEQERLQEQLLRQEHRDTNENDKLLHEAQLNMKKVQETLEEAKELERQRFLQQEAREIKTTRGRIAKKGKRAARIRSRKTTNRRRKDKRRRTATTRTRNAKAIRGRKIEAARNAETTGGSSQRAAAAAGEATKTDRRAKKTSRRRTRQENEMRH